MYYREYRTGGITRIKERKDLSTNDRSWIYGLLGSSDEVFYVGQTVAKPEARVGQHRYQGHWWSAQISDFRTFEVSFRDLRTAEQTLIHGYHPWGNTACVFCPGNRIDHRTTPPVLLLGSDFLALNQW